MNFSIWIGAATTLLGAAIGGLISFALSRQQIRANRVQQTSDQLHQERQQSKERRLQAYSDFLTRSRSARNALRAYYLASDHKPSMEALDDLFHSAQDAASVVFLMLETEDTYNACVQVLRALGTAQTIIHEQKSAEDAPWQNLRADLGKATRAFQNAARRELGVSGPSEPWVEKRSREHLDALLPADKMTDLSCRRPERS